ncbi:MAG: N-acetylmuramoyl-L-alanine amidase [Gammaproteobacteria bacterium]|nr:N-acetylmuramoyl-L-alanine amidase [Gammaproteobacteria bacterium]
MGRRRSLESIDTLVIHCSATPNGRWTTPEDIDRWHAARGFRRDMSISPHDSPGLLHIGYHYVLLTTGAVTMGRPEIESGAHVTGHNDHTIGLCMIGTDAFSPAQWETLCRHVTQQQQRRPGIRVCGHRDLSPDRDGDGRVEAHEWLKICPGFSVADWLAGGMTPLPGHIFAAGGST